MKSRTENSIRNLIFAMIGQGLGILISFVSRLIFVRILSSEYLGLSGLFTNILTILSLTELGFVTAMSYQLYKPISIDDKEKIKSLIKFYKRIYLSISFIIFVLGLITLPFYTYLMNEVPNIPNLDLIYMLFVINTSATYLFSHKRLLIIGDQKRYVATIYRYSFYFILNVIQIIILLLTKNYILFLIVQILMTLLENICLNRKANKMYPYLKEKNVSELSKNDYSQIIKNVKAMFFHKFGGVVLNSTDNIVISKVLGLIKVGIYSNYILIITALKNVITQIFSSIIASIGNLQVNSDRKKMTDVFLKTFFADYFIHAISTICLVCLLNPFIYNWLGKKYLLDTLSVVMISINYYLFGMRRTCMSFREATGNYKSDKYSPIIEAAINIVSSIVLANYYGLAGVVMGTIVSCLATNFWWEPLVIIRKSLDITLVDYYKYYFKYTIQGLLIGALVVFLNSFIPYSDIYSLIVKFACVFFLTLLIFVLVYRKNKYYLFYKKLIKKKVLKKGKDYLYEI